MAAADVDEIWAEMQQEQKKISMTRPSKKVTQGTSFDISALQFERPKAKGQKKKLDSSLQWMQGWAAPSLKPRGQIGVPQDAFSGCTDADGPTDAEFMRMTEPPTTLIDTLEDIPMETPETFLAYLQRDVNCLGEDTLSVRLQSLQKLERMLVRQADSLPTDILDAVADALLKPLLKRMKDKSEKCRELSAKILRSLVENTSDLSSMLPYIFPTLVMRLGSEDLDGVAHLPEVMRPKAEQKPTEIAKPVEDSEEVRLELARFVAAVLRRCNQTQIYSWIDEATGLLRSQCMDPFHEVKSHACETMSTFCYNHCDMLLHFTEPLGRSLTSCLTHNHAKIRIAGLRALTAVLHCGMWKHNHEVIQMLMAWQDPNSVPIKAFYESVTTVNYMSVLSFDRHPAVRRFWYETLAYWLLKLPDKCDHEPYIFPYLLTGLCDENEEIALEIFWLIEKCGEAYEAEHEEDLRKARQYGFDHGWTYAGRALVPFPLQGVWAGGGYTGSVRRQAAAGPDLMGEIQREDHILRDKELDDEEECYGEEVQIPTREYEWPLFSYMKVFKNLPRPRLGSRCWVRTNARRYIKATFNDVVDFRDCTALNAGRLLCMTIAYTEEGVTEWLQPMIAALCKFYSGRAAASGDVQVLRTFNCVCKLLGGFLDPDSIWTQLKDALDADSALYLDQRVASVRVLALCIEGTVATLQSVENSEQLGMGRLERVIPEMISMMHASDLLLSPSEESRQVMWDLMFSFLEPLRSHMTFSQISKLLYVALALSAKAPAEASTERATKKGEVVDVPLFEAEELVDAHLLEKALDILSSCVGREEHPQNSSFNLDDLDDGLAPAVPPTSSDPRMVHQDLFRRAFPEVISCLDDSFQVFRSVLYLSPLSVLISPEQVGVVLKRLVSFCGPSASPPTRSAGHALGVHLACRCARSLENSSNTSDADDVRNFMVKLFQFLAKAHMDVGDDYKNLSYAVIISSLSLWRRFFTWPLADPRNVLFPSTGEPSRPLQWLASLIADQELYKKFHNALEHAEKAHTGKDKDDFVIMTSKNIRESADRRAANVRAFAASTVLVVLRRILADGQGPIPWSSSKQAGSVHSLFLAVASLFRTAAPSLKPNFVKPTQPPMALYAAELLHLLLNQSSAPAPFRLQDDAARAIHDLKASSSSPVMPLSLEPEERETLVAEFVGTLVDLNLTLPPDPEAKHAPVSLGSESGDDIVLGWAGAGDVSSGSSSGWIETSPIPSEVTRLLSQSEECLRWNAALALYTLGVDLSVLCQDGFKRCLGHWRKQRAAARVLIAGDLLARAEAAARRSMTA